MIGLIGPDSTIKALFASLTISNDGSLPSNIMNQNYQDSLLVVVGHSNAS